MGQPNYIKYDWFSFFEEEHFDLACVTTNGIVKANGFAVMGAGIAKSININYNDSNFNVAQELGAAILKNGNVVQGFCEINDSFIVSFPTKNHWRDKSSLALIEKSCKELIELMNKHNKKNALLNYPGIGFGGLTKEEVEPILNKYLDERVTVCYL